MVAVNSATLKQLQQQEDIRSVIVQAATRSEPFAKLIQQIRLRERPVYRFNPQNSRIEVVTDGLSEADTEMIETCEKHIEEIHDSAWKQYLALQPAEQKVCEDEPSSHSPATTQKPSRVTATTTERGFRLLMFRDSDGRECSLQQSSATDDTDRGMQNPGTSFVWLAFPYSECSSHISREQTRFLAYHLQRWLDTGKFD